MNQHVEQEVHSNDAGQLHPAVGEPCGLALQLILGGTAPGVMVESSAPP